jgi:DNA-binding transcriptional LysR family regulator
MGTDDLSQLALFVAVAEARSFTRAADRARVPKSSASRGIARLEASLGHQLFYRTTRRVTLTSAGTALYERVAPHLAALRGSLGTLPEAREEPSGVLRVTAPNDLGVSFLADLAVGFCARFPAVRIEARLTVQTVDLVAEGIDVALRAAPRLKDSSLVARRLCAIEGQLFAAPGYLARHGTPRSTAELAAHDLTQFRGRTWPEVETRGAPRERPARIVGDDYGFVREVLRSGGGIGLLPSFLATDDLRAGSLVRVLPRVSISQGALFLVQPAARHVPRRVGAFRDFVLERLASRPLTAHG